LAGCGSSLTVGTTKWLQIIVLAFPPSANTEKALAELFQQGLLRE